MKITLSLNKTTQQNASSYFDKAKKLKKKLEGAKTALIVSKEKMQVKEKEEKPAVKKKKIIRKTEWYEKFRWFFSSEGFLCIGGRDATTNEIVIKKYTEKDDIVFHTDMAGSPFFVIKTDGKKPGEKTMNETAQATASYAKAWDKGLTMLEVFYVNPDQVSKEAQSGEFMAKGSFMIRGKTNYLQPELRIAIGIKEGEIIGGPVEAVKSNAEKYVGIVPGNEKSSDMAKKIKKELGFEGSLDDIIRFIPAGGSRAV